MSASGKKRTRVHSTGIIDSILRQREWKNERNVAIVRFILAITWIPELLSFTGLIDFGSGSPALETLLISTFLFVYSSIILVVVLFTSYRNIVKYVVISLDYFFIFLNFWLDSSLGSDPVISVWYAFGGCGIFFLINLLRYSRGGTLYAMILTAISYVAVTLTSHSDVNTVLQVAMPLVIILIIGYSITRSNKAMLAEAGVKQMMERYLAPQLVDQLYENSSDLESSASSRKVCILFSDIRSFTSISEKLKPEQIVNLLNAYLSKMTEEIFRYQGTIDKFIGDAIMTVFGAPLSGPDDALGAVKTAIGMQRALEVFNREYPDLPEPLRMGIGIHSGLAVAGNIGSEHRMDYTVIGDSVNTASRIESLTAKYGCPIIVSSDVCSQLNVGGEDFLVRELDAVVVKGRHSAVRIYEIVHPQSDSQAKEKQLFIARFEKALALYRKQKFNSAMELFEQLKDDNASQLYIQRCKSLLKNPPPPSWRGVHLLKEK